MTEGDRWANATESTVHIESVRSDYWCGFAPMPSHRKLGEDEKAKGRMCARCQRNRKLARTRAVVDSKKPVPDEPLPRYGKEVMRKLANTSVTGESLPGGRSYVNAPKLLGTNWFAYSKSSTTESEFRRLRTYMRRFLMGPDVKRALFFVKGDDYIMALPKWIIEVDLVREISAKAIGREPGRVLSR